MLKKKNLFNSVDRRFTTVKGNTIDAFKLKDKLEKNISQLNEKVTAMKVNVNSDVEFSSNDPSFSNVISQMCTQSQFEDENF